MRLRPQPPRGRQLCSMTPTYLAGLRCRLWRSFADFTKLASKNQGEIDMTWSWNSIHFRHHGTVTLAKRGGGARRRNGAQPASAPAAAAAMHPKNPWTFEATFDFNQQYCVSSSGLLELLNRSRALSFQNARCIVLSASPFFRNNLRLISWFSISVASPSTPRFFLISTLWHHNSPFMLMSINVGSELLSCRASPSNSKPVLLTTQLRMQRSSPNLVTRVIDALIGAIVVA